MPGNFRRGHSCKKPQFGDGGLPLAKLSKFPQRLVNLDHVIGRAAGNGEEFIQLRGPPTSAPLVPFFMASMVDQDSSHGLSAGRQEVCPPLPVDFLLINQLQERFVDQGRWAQCVSRSFVSELCLGDLPQFLIDHIDQLAGRRCITLAGAAQKLCQVGRCVWSVHGAHGGGL